MLKSSAAAVLLAAVPHGLAFPPAGARAGQLGYAEFAAQVDTLFKVRLSSGGVASLRLVKAQLASALRGPRSARPSLDAGNERFSLIFRGPEACPLPAAIHTFEHEALGIFSIYFGEIGARDGAGIRYEAVFNQATSQDRFV